MSTFCSVVLDDCLAPAGWIVGGSGYAPGTPGRRAECFACGQPVCTNCSRVRSYLNYGRKRICASCEEEFAKR